MRFSATFWMTHFSIVCPNFIFLSPSLPPPLWSDLIVCLASYFIVCSQQNKRNWEVDQQIWKWDFLISSGTQINWELKSIENSNHLRTQINWELRSIENSNQLRTQINWELKSIENSNRLRTQINWELKPIKNTQTNLDLRIRLYEKQCIPDCWVNRFHSAEAT